VRVKGKKSRACLKRGGDSGVLREFGTFKNSLGGEKLQPRKGAKKGKECVGES